jgi:hypothetical protein
MEAIFTAYCAITNIKVCSKIMSLKECQELSQQLLEDGYKPINGFKPHTNEGLTNGKVTIMWEFKN